MIRRTMPKGFLLRLLPRWMTKGNCVELINDSSTISIKEPKIEDMKILPAMRSTVCGSILGVVNLLNKEDLTKIESQKHIIWLLVSCIEQLQRIFNKRNFECISMTYVDDTVVDKPERTVLTRKWADNNPDTTICGVQKNGYVLTNTPISVCDALISSSEDLAIAYYNMINNNMEDNDLNISNSKVQKFIMDNLNLSKELLQQCFSSNTYNMIRLSKTNKE